MNECSKSEIEFKQNSKEEVLPDYCNDFLYTATRYIANKKRIAPWHWHKAIELFYIESGAIEYNTPSGKVILTKGCGGMINSGILHMTELNEEVSQCVQLIHFFDTTLITGHIGSRIDQKYISPITGDTGLEIIPLWLDQPDHVPVLEKLKKSFFISENDVGFEIKLRSALSEIWVDLLNLPLMVTERGVQVSNEKIKLMMTYVHEHYGEKVNIADIANAAFISERECYRTFQAILHMTPTEYIRKYRLQAACRLLSNTEDSITNICQSCGFGSSSFFGKVFREHMNMTPLEYRNHVKKIPS